MIISCETRTILRSREQAGTLLFNTCDRAASTFTPHTRYASDRAASKNPAGINRDRRKSGHLKGSEKLENVALRQMRNPDPIRADHR